MPFGRCGLCQEYRQLCNSHALPEAQFRPIFKKDSGKAIVVVDDAVTPTSHSADSWDTYQLCTDCEERLNSQYDSYGIAAFKGRKGKVKRDSVGVSIQGVDCNRLRMFLLSVLWRMSKSVHRAYLNTHLPEHLQIELRSSFLSNGQFSGSRLHTSVRRLHDSSASGTIKSELFRDVVISPFIRNEEKAYSILFIVFGFLVQIHVPGLPLRERKMLHILNPKSRTMFAPLIEFTAVPEIFDLAVRARGKELKGVTHIADA